MSRNATIDAGNVVLSDLRAKGGSCRSARRTVRRIDTSAGNAKLPGHLCRQVAGAGDGAWFRCTRSRVTLQFYLGL